MDRTGATPFGTVTSGGSASGWHPVPDINADRHDQPGLMIAARHHQVEVVRLLIERGALLDHTAKSSLSATMLAVINGHVEIIRMLAQAGADLALRGSGAPGFHDKTALDLADARGDHAMVEVLQSRAGS